LEEQKEQKVEARTGGAFRFIWDFFISLKLTVTLLIILAGVSIIGTVVDQTDPAKNMEMLVAIFGPGRAGGVLDLMIKTGLTNMYHSYWFVGLLSTLSLNIAVCTVDRFPRVWYMVTRAQEPLTDDMLRTLGNKRDIKAKASPADLKEKVKSAIKSSGFSPKEREEGGVVHVFAESGKFSRLGVYITHVSVLIIFAGAIVGSFWGYKGYVQIIEGASVDKIGLLNKPLLVNVGPEMPIDFKVRCDKFVLKLYEGSQMTSDYLSTLTVVDKGQDVMTKTIRVNDPLEYKSIRFYQSSYGVMPEMAAMVIRAYAKSGKGTLDVHDYNMKRGQVVHLEGSPYDMMISEMAADVAMGPDKKLVPQSDQFKGSGAALMNFTDKTGKPVDQAMIFNMNPDSQPQVVPYRFEIMNYRGPYYTGLQVTYDPGVWVVWLGCALMVLGILVAFFTYHKRIWVRITEGDKGQSVITVAGAANKNRHVFEREFRQLAEKIEGK